MEYSASGAGESKWGIVKMVAHYNRPEDALENTSLWTWYDSFSVIYS